MNTYRITLGDGTELAGLTATGNNFISKSKLSETDFAGKLNGVNIEYTGDEEYHGLEYMIGMHEHMKLLYCKQIYGYEGWLFCLSDYSDDEMKAMKLESRLSYLEMITEESEYEAE